MDEYIKKLDIKKAFLKGFTDRKKYPEFVNWMAKEAERIVSNMPSADVQPVNQWISVKERLPEIGKSVLIYYPKWDGDEIQTAKLEGDGMMFDICGEFNIGVGVITHWMPLPEPPKGGETNG